jgi:hypothetical protein
MTTNLNALRQERNKPNTLIRLIGSSTSPYKKRRTSVGNVVFSRVEHRKMREQDAEYKKKVKDLQISYFF